MQAALEDIDTALMAVNIPDSRKGERIVLLSETALDAKTVKATMLANGTPPMMIPSHWFTVETIPHLGSGKADFAGAKRLAQAQLEDAD
ncbi:hypothetical protein BDK62_117114 [Halomonas alkaliantarctica]|nr:hypothetical protein BDK62_117114 [Halomonas alkaliantarctica]